MTSSHNSDDMTKDSQLRVIHRYSVESTMVLKIKNNKGHPCQGMFHRYNIKYTILLKRKEEREEKDLVA